ncbi:hypothetical protein OEZ84_28300, partial [Leclercia adecarboxylata]|uniref:hypothetical protein n=1 Tax=Leclercia adecarboxylata TaxID=83655 RepID=UPI00234C5CEC
VWSIDKKKSSSTEKTFVCHNFYGITEFRPPNPATQVAAPGQPRIPWLPSSAHLNRMAVTVQRSAFGSSFLAPEEGDRYG